MDINKHTCTHIKGHGDTTILIYQTNEKNKQYITDGTHCNLLTLY
jgi:hypothetical protein